MDRRGGGTPFSRPFCNQLPRVAMNEVHRREGVDATNTSIEQTKCSKKHIELLLTNIILLIN